MTGTDVILISHAEGLMNSMSSTKEWNYWKERTSVRVFTLAPGSKSAKAMTELSDAVFCVQYGDLYSLNGRFGSFVESIDGSSNSAHHRYMPKNWV